MPNRQNSDSLTLNSVDDAVLSVKDLSDVSSTSLWNHPTALGELSSLLNTVENRIHPTFGRLRIVASDVVSDFARPFDRYRCPCDRHRAIFSRTERRASS